MTYSLKKLKFEVQIKRGIRADKIGSLTDPINPPCFILNFNDDWNDYGYSDWFALFYAIDNVQINFLGELKIMSTKEGTTFDLIKNGFESLDETFCSVGMSVKYYENIYKFFGKDDANRLLQSLRDCAVNVEVRNEFENNEEYIDALTRDIDIEKVFREARFIVKGQTMSESYSFDYFFHPIYNVEQFLEWKVSFKYKSKLYERYVGIIGENGTGKTQLLKSLIRNLVSENKDGKFIKKPIYSCVFTICSTPYDKYDEIKATEYSLPYFSVTSEQNRQSTEEQIQSCISKIFKRGMLDGKTLTQVYVSSIKKMLPNIDTNILIYQDDKYGIPNYCVNKEYLHDTVERQSSGERHLFLLLSETFSNIYLNTLFILDEPELHLHPKAIIDLMEMLSYILEIFDSFCIIATHSPLIIREIPSKNVYLISRNDNIMNIGSLPGQTFGEDISKLYQDIFGYDEGKSLFTRTVKRMINANLSFEEIVKNLSETEDLSMNAMMTINSLINEVRKNA